MSVSVIVAPANNFIALTVIRSLGRSGFNVIAIVTRPLVAHTSRYCAEVIWAEPDDLAEAAIRTACEFPSSFILGLGELEIESLNRRREDLSRVATLLFPDDEHFALALNKQTTMEIASSVGVPVPRTVDLALENASVLFEGLNFPVVIKPKRQDVVPFKVKYCASLQDLRSQLLSMSNFLDVLLVQEQIQGQGIGVELLIRQGRTVLAFQHRRIREDPPSGGVSVCCVSEPLNPQLQQFAERLLAKMNWEGVAMVEFKLEPRTGRAVLLEVNGRFWGSLPLAVHAGADFPAVLVASHLGEKTPHLGEYRCNLVCRRLIGETKWLVTVLRDGSLPAWRAIIDYLWAFRPGVKYFVWEWDDPYPAIKLLLGRLKLVLRKLRLT